MLEDPAATVDAFVRHCRRSALADATVNAYDTGARRFSSWLATSPHHVPLDVFTDPLSRDQAVRDFRGYLLHGQRLAGSSVDTYLVAVSALFTWLGLGPHKVTRVMADKRGDYGERLDPAADRAVMRAAERRGPRDLAIVALMRMAGLRAGEVHRLNVGDVLLTARTGPVQVLGKGDKVRTVHLGPKGREALRAWMIERHAWPGADSDPALFLAERGGRLSLRSLRYVVAEIGKAAGVPGLHPHQLRHAFAYSYLAGGGMATELQVDLGHQSLATTAIYTQPTTEERAASTARAEPDW